WHWHRTGQPRWKKALWHLRYAWNRDAARKFSAILATQKPDIVHTHEIDGFSASIWNAARQAGIPVMHTAHDYHLLCPRALLLTRNNQPYSSPPNPAYALYRAWHMCTTRYVDLFCAPSQFLLDQHQRAGLRAPT